MKWSASSFSIAPELAKIREVSVVKLAALILIAHVHAHRHAPPLHRALLTLYAHFAIMSLEYAAVIGPSKRASVEQLCEELENWLAEQEDAATGASEEMVSWQSQRRRAWLALSIVVHSRHANISLIVSRVF